MARVAREKSRTGIYHVMLRGVNRGIIFQDDEDREFFLGKLKFFKGKCKYSLYAYCLMDNHIHILMKEMDDEISTSMKRICSSYVFWYNKKYERCGHLFQERFKSEVVESEGYFLTVLRYIHQNPIKAGIAKTMGNSNWTSYNEYISEPHIIDVEFGLSLFSNDIEKAKNLFINYHNEINSDKCLDHEDYVRLSDSEAMERIVELGIKNIHDLQHLDKSNRNYILKKLKSINGISIRQLSRITGISKSVIDRA